MRYLQKAVEYKPTSGDTKERIRMSALYQRKKKAHPTRQSQNERLTNLSKVSISPESEDCK
jgi:hypothetical protein